jgi:hemoglobin-like flavoprotein
MTPQQIELVQTSFARVTPMSDEAGRIFYGRLFNIAPDIRVLFRGDMDEQSRKLMAMLAAVVNGLRDLDTIVPAAEALAIRHLDYGVKAEHYKPVGEALVWTLEQGLGDAFDDQTREAWEAAYRLLTDVMIKTAYKTTAREGATA